MIVVKIELRSARTGKVRPLGEVHIWNDGTSTNPHIGNYGTRFFGQRLQTLGRSCVVQNWPRLRKPIFSLLKEVLAGAGY